jgi:hypothetical protein
METAKGILAFISCPLFGRLSDQVGRKYCLLFTVIGNNRHNNNNHNNQHRFYNNNNINNYYCYH